MNRLLKGTGFLTMTNINKNTENGYDDELHTGGLERSLFGKWTIWFRNLGGIIATVSVCVAALFNCYTTHMSILSGSGWPSDT